MTGDERVLDRAARQVNARPAVGGDGAAVDRTARNAMIAQAEQIFVDDNLFIPIQYNGLYYAVSDRLEGFVSTPEQDGIMINYATLK